jgi:hypothetical protein
MGVTVGGYDLKNAIVDGQEGHIEGTWQPVDIPKPAVDVFIWSHKKSVL